GLGDVYKRQPVDWVKFTAQGREIYTIQTSFLRERADTLLTLYDTDGQTVLAENDNCLGASSRFSCLSWIAPRDGLYHLLVSNKDGITGVGTDYILRLENRESPALLYLPIVVRNYNRRHPVYLPIVLRQMIFPP
ncbi:MAG: hypothetical protein N2508_12815, partial [Anaerolineae bacterium]|nr:hypothetical protein [Anaerolineae bacterium]